MKSCVYQWSFSFQVPLLWKLYIKTGAKKINKSRKLSGLEQEQQVQLKLSTEHVEGGDGTDTTDVSLEHGGKRCQTLTVNI